MTGGCEYCPKPDIMGQSSLMIDDPLVRLLPQGRAVRADRPAGWRARSGRRKHRIVRLLWVII